MNSAQLKSAGSHAADRIADIFERHEWGWLLRPLKKAVSFIYTAAPYLFSALFGDLVNQLYTKQNFWYWPIWRNHWHIVPIGIIWGVCAVFERYSLNKGADRESVRREIESVYEQLNLGQDPDADVRFTVWIPKRTGADGVPVRLEQWTDYVPSRSHVPDGINFRSNAGAGRGFKVYRVGDSVVKPVGILGYCIIDSIQKNAPDIYIDSVPDGTVLVDHLVKNWNFRRRHAERLTQDRKCFMCLPVMDAGRKKMLGIVYLDTRKSDVLVREVGEKIEKSLPKIASALKAE